MNFLHKTRLNNLNRLIQEAGSVTELAKLAGYKQPSYLYQLINRTPVQNGKAKNIGNAMAQKLEKAMDKPAGWMDNEHTVISANSTYLGTLNPWDSNTPLNHDEVEVPFYKEICLSAGDGFADDIEDHNGFKLRFSRQTLARLSIDPEHVICVTADGDSMYPMFSNGATLGIDTNSKVIKDGKIYAFNHSGLLRTKILQRLPDNKIRIKSFNNESYPDEVANLEDVHIIGRIFWTSELLF